MKTYWRLLGFAKPIEKYAIPYFFCTLLYAFFNVCTFTLIMPIVNSLFSPDGALQAVTEMPVFSIRHLTDYISALLSYLLYRLFGSDYDIMDVLIMLACVVVTASLLSNLFRYLAQRIIENMRVRTLCRLRDRVYEHVLSMNLGFFSNERKGDIMARITSDVQVVQFCITNTLQVVFRDPFLILFYVVAMLAISVQLSLFSVIYLPVVALLIGTIVKRLRRSAKEVQESFGELTSVLDESLSGMKVIKGYNAETFFGRRFNDINRKFSDISRRIAYRQQLASPMSEFLGIAAAAGLLIFGGILVTGGKLDAGGFLTYLAIFTQITRPMRSFTDAFATINQGIAAGDRVLRLLDTETSVRNAPDAVQLDHFRERIEFRDVRFAYEEREVICGISFTVEKGQTVALVGPSGGGKSTISDLIPRFYDVTAGEIRIDGRDIRQYDLHSLRERMGIVAQDTVLFNDTIENNIRLGNSEATREEVMDAARIANAEQFIAETPYGLETNIGDRGAKLSGGQRQRLSIARAVLKNPEILILDEATSALDTESEKLVQEALNTLLEGRTSIVIAHRLSTIRNADKIIVIEQGRITEEGTHTELISRKGTYAKLIEMQQLSCADGGTTGNSSSEQAPREHNPTTIPPLPTDKQAFPVPKTPVSPNVLHEIPPHNPHSFLGRRTLHPAGMHSAQPAGRLVHDLRRRPGYTHRPLHRYMQRLRRTASRLATLRRGYVHLSDNGHRQTGKAEAMDSRHPQGRRTAHRLPLRRQRAGSTPHQHADRQGNLRHLRPRHLRRRRPDAGNLP